MKSFEEIVFNEEKDAPIVLIDSGSGGIHVLEKLTQEFPVENFVMVCDNEMLPLGNKDPKIINRRINKINKKIKELAPKAIVIACNTIDAICYNTINSAFPKIPVYSVIIPTITAAMKQTRNKEIGLLGTKVTIESQAYMKYALLKSKLNIYGVECTNLATAIEQDDNIDKVLNQEISVLEEIKCDTLILGCTHYSIIRDKIQKKIGDCKIIDSSEELVKSIKEDFQDYKKNKANKQEVYILITKEDELIYDNIAKTLNTKNEIIVLNI